MNRRHVIIAGGAAAALIGVSCYVYLATTRSTVVREESEIVYESVHFAAQLESDFATRTSAFDLAELESIFADTLLTAIDGSSTRHAQSVPANSELVSLASKYCSAFFHADYQAWFEIASEYDPALAGRMDDQSQNSWHSTMAAYKHVRVDLDRVSARYLRDVGEFPENEPMTFIVSGRMASSRYGADYKAGEAESLPGVEFLIPMLYRDENANEYIPATLGLRFSIGPGGGIRPSRSYIYLTAAGMGRPIKPPVGF